MGLIIYLTAALLYLTSLAIDITAFFLLMKAIKYRWNPGWVEAFDSAGKALTDGWLGWIEKTAQTKFNKRLSTRGLFIWACIILLAVKLVLIVFIEILTV